MFVCSPPLRVSASEVRKLFGLLQVSENRKEHTAFLLEPLSSEGNAV
jgi:hypothetical protein